MCPYSSLIKALRERTYHSPQDEEARSRELVPRQCRQRNGYWLRLQESSSIQHHSWAREGLGWQRKQPWAHPPSPQEPPPPGSLQNQLEGISLRPWEAQRAGRPLKQSFLMDLGCPQLPHTWGGISPDIPLPVQWLFLSTGNLNSN